MSLKIGIVGLPNVGKSTLFNALTKKQSAQASNFPFTTIDPNIGIVDLPDQRLDQIANLANSAKTIPATVTFVDIAGLVAGAHKGEGLGNKFLSHIREVDAIAMVVRDFTDPDVTHVSGEVNPKSDIEVIQTELVLADLETVEGRLGKLEREVKSGDKDALALQQVLIEAKKTLEEGRGLNSLPYSDNQKNLLKQLQLLSLKPLFFILNVDENEIGGAEERIKDLQTTGQLPTSSPVIPVSAKVEAELTELSSDEQAEYLADLGIAEPGLNKVIKTAFDTLGLITYFTAGPKEARAWTINDGDLAPRAAAAIHTDFERGFIKAEVISFNDYVTNQGELGAKEAGKLRQEGKGYLVKDGDVIHFKFNV
ncbi:redox-regulated ATPase YchF [Candidatus Berkelbacteria bacterium]|nr:redox-regulated ATPase YchF [Candidatus Berkelbacteria bacterium]